MMLMRDGLQPPPSLDVLRRRWLALSEAERSARLDADERAAEQECFEGILASYRRLAGIEDAMTARTFETFQPRSDAQRNALSASREFVAAFPHCRKGLMLYGEPGRGKSGLMQAIINAIYARRRLYRMFYIPCAEIDRLRDEMDVALAARESVMVVLDDLEKALDPPGSRYRSPGDAIVRGILQSADRRRRPIICATSNHGPEDWKRRSTALHSRLAGLCDWIEVNGPDLRTL